VFRSSLLHLPLVPWTSFLSWVVYLITIELSLPSCTLRQPILMHILTMLPTFCILSLLVSTTMSTTQTHQEVIHAYLLMMLTRNLFTPHHSLEEACQQFNVDAKIILALAETRLPQWSRSSCPKGWKHASFLEICTRP